MPSFVGGICVLVGFLFGGALTVGSCVLCFFSDNMGSDLGPGVSLSLYRRDKVQFVPWVSTMLHE